MKRSKIIEFAVRYFSLKIFNMKNAVFWDVAPCRYCVN
jgi:hypothetical protein